MILFDIVVVVDSTSSFRRSFLDTRRESFKVFFVCFNVCVVFVFFVLVVCSDVVMCVLMVLCVFVSVFGIYGVVRMLKVGIVCVLYFFCDCSVCVIEGVGVDGVDGVIVCVVVCGEFFGV